MQHRVFWRVVLLLIIALAVIVVLPGAPASAQDWADKNIDAAFADVSARIGQTVSRYQRLSGSWSWEGLTVSDNNLGCPNGQQNAPGVTWAMKIVININNVGSFDYRASRDGSIFFLCSGPGVPTGPAVPPAVQQPLAQSPTTYTGEVFAYIGADANVYIHNLTSSLLPAPLTNDANGRRTNTYIFYEQDRNYGSLTWSPDGQSLLFTEGRDNKVYLANSGQAPVELPTGKAYEFPAVWSPDGSEIGYAVHTGQTINPGDPASDEVFQLQAIPRSGGAPRAVGTFSAYCLYGGDAWPNPAEMLYWNEVGVMGRHVVFAWLPGGILHSNCFATGLRLTAFSGQTLWDYPDLFGAKVSPDRTRAVALRRTGDFTPPQVVLVNLADGALTPLATQPNVDQFAWSADGQTLFYSTARSLGRIEPDPASAVGAQLVPFWPAIGAEHFELGLWSIPAIGGQSTLLYTAQGQSIAAIAPSPHSGIVAFSEIGSAAPFMQGVNANEPISSLLTKLPEIKIGVVALDPALPGYPYFLSSPAGRPAFTRAVQYTAVPVAAPSPVGASDPGAAALCTLAPRLTIGGQGRVTPGEPNSLNSLPAPPSRDPNSRRLALIGGGDVFEVLGGPVCAWGINWWQVRYLNTVGWTGEGQGTTYWLEPHAPSGAEQFTCAGAPPPRMVVGGQGRVTPGEPNALNTLPAPASKDPNSRRLEPIPAGGEFTVLEGPVCAWGYIWWRVNYRGNIGWTAEGEGSAYWLEPIR